MIFLCTCQYNSVSITVQCYISHHQKFLSITKHSPDSWWLKSYNEIMKVSKLWTVKQHSLTDAILCSSSLPSQMYWLLPSLIVCMPGRCLVPGGSHLKLKYLDIYLCSPAAGQWPLGSAAATIVWLPTGGTAEKLLIRWNSAFDGQGKIVRTFRNPAAIDWLSSRQEMHCGRQRH